MPWPSRASCRYNVRIVCHRCGKFGHPEVHFPALKLPFRRARIYCPECYLKLEEKFLIGLFALVLLMGATSCKKSSLSYSGSAVLSQGRGSLAAAAAGNKILFAGFFFFGMRIGGKYAYAHR